MSHKTQKMVSVIWRDDGDLEGEISMWLLQVLHKQQVHYRASVCKTVIDQSAHF